MDSRKVLIAVDGSENSMRAVEYTGRMLGGQEGFRIMLISIERFPDRDLFKDDESWKERCLEMRGEIQNFLAEARNVLVSLQIPGDAIQEKYISSCHSPFADRGTDRCSYGTSIAQELLNVLKEEGYGTVVLGRRGMSKAEEFLFGSVSNKIIHHAKGCTVWVVA